MWMVPVKPELYFPKIQDIFDEQGVMKPDFTQMYEKNVQTAFSELIWMARALKRASAAQ
jgi:hypothetical protein